MTLVKARSFIVAFVLWGLGVCVAAADAPAGWTVAGSAPQDFDFSRDAKEGLKNQGSALITAKPGVVSQGFSTLMQTISAETYGGSRVRFSGYLKTRDAIRAQMWMRVDGLDRKVLAFDNMDARPITGTTDWSRYEIVLDVPANSADIAFGFLLTQSGKVWGGNFKLDKVDSAVTLTSVAPATLPKVPQNMDFADELNPGSELDDASYQNIDVRIFDLYRAEGRVSPHHNEHFRTIDESGAQFYETAKYNLCGMHLVAESRESDKPARQWDVKLSVIEEGGRRVGSIAAGSFILPAHSKIRVPRPAIKALEIKLKGESESASAHFHGAANADNGVIGEFPELYATKIFDAFDNGTPFTLEVTYQAGNRDTVTGHASGGGIGGTVGKTPILVFHGSNAPTRRCLRSLAATSETGVANRVIELEHPW